jgi:DNA polymerase-3 subunit beta
MKLECLQENLAKGLSIVGRSVATRSTLPITSHVLMQTEGGRLKLSATDLQTAAVYWLGASVEEEGSIAIPARLLTDFVNSLPSGKIHMVLPSRSRQLKLDSARNEASIGGMDADDFPRIPTVEGGLTITMDPPKLKRAIERVTFAAATDDSRPVLTGVHLLLEDSQLTLAAADGFRLAVSYLPLDQQLAERTELIVPARALQELGRLLGDQPDSIEMRVNDGRTQVLFALKDIEMTATLIQGTFPNYQQLIPSDYSTRVKVPVSEFQREVKIAAIFARDGSGIVRLQVVPAEDGVSGKITVSARADEVGDNLGELDGEVQGDPAKIAFNSRYLQDVLNALDEPEVVLDTTSPSSPGVVRPCLEGKPVDDYVHVVMPMFVQW